MATSRFTSSLALPSEHTDATGSVWIQQDESRLLLPEESSRSNSLQEARRQELTTYLQHLKHKQLAEPSADLTFGTDFYTLVQHLSEQQKTEYKSVRGWVPMPNRLPSATPLANPSADPKIQEGLHQILQLDERLMQKSVEASMVARETFPETWSAADKKQAERDQKLLLASLERERARQARANKLAHAVEQLNCEGDKENSGDAGQLQRPLYSLLQPAETALVEQLLAQPSCDKLTWMCQWSDHQIDGIVSQLMFKQKLQPSNTVISSSGLVVSKQAKADSEDKDDEEAWRDNPFDYEAVPVQTKTDSPQCTSVALLDDRIQACQIECTQSCDSSQEDCRLSQMTSESASGHLPGSSTDSPQLTTTDASYHPSAEDVSLVEALMKDDKTDHLTARRQAKQLADTLQQIDAKLRALQMSELPAAPSKAELDQLLSECHRRMSVHAGCGDPLSHDQRPSSQQMSTANSSEFVGTASISC